jgi:hypothetical protein
VPGADMVLAVKARVKSSGTIAMRSVVQMQVQVLRGKQRAGAGAAKRRRKAGGGETPVAVLSAGCATTIAAYKALSQRATRVQLALWALGSGLWLQRCDCCVELELEAYVSTARPL